MKNKLKLLVAFLIIMFIPCLVNAKEITSINLKNIVVPVVGEDSNTPANTAVTTDTEGVSIDLVQWQTKNSSVYDDKYKEGTTYGVFIQFVILDGYELSDEVTFNVNETPLKIEHYQGTDWVIIYYKTPGKGVTHTVSFDMGGADSLDPIEVEDEDILQIPYYPEREGYSFDGWYLDSSFKEEYCYTCFTITKDITVYAKWTLLATIKNIDTINIKGVELPKAGQVASTTAFVDTEGLTTKVAQWETTDSHVYSGKFELGKKYCLFIGYDTLDYYEVNLNATVTANIKPESYQVVSGGVDLCYTVKEEVKVPFEINSTSVKTTSIKLSWNKVSEAKGYIVYSSTNNKKWKKVTTIKKNSTLTYNVKKLKAGTKYYFKVEAYKVVKKKNKKIDTSNVLSTITVPGKPKITVSNKSYSSLKVTVKKVTGSSKFEIYRSLSKNGTYTKVGELTGAGTYTDEGLDLNKTYYYKVRACNKEDKCGSYSSVANKKTSLTAPSGLKKSVKPTEITVSYKEVSGATGYEIYKSTKKKSGFKSAGSIDGNTSYTIKGLSANKTYYVKVRAYRLVDGKKVYGPYSKVLTAKTSKLSKVQKNAIEQAKRYLKVLSFSREGLIEQLEFHKYSTSVATFAVDSLNVNWNSQAVKSAKNYLSFMAFSYNDLIEQLEFEGFTHEQALYGVNHIDVNWNEQAVRKANEYLDVMPFSPDELIEQLEFEGFTHEQALYGVQHSELY